MHAQRSMYQCKGIECDNFIFMLLTFIGKINFIGSPHDTNFIINTNKQQTTIQTMAGSFPTINKF